MAEAKSTPVAEKSAADLLIEMQLAEKVRKETNPMAVADEAEVSEKTDDGTTIINRRTYANGTVLETFS